MPFNDDLVFWTVSIKVENHPQIDSLLCQIWKDGNRTLKDIKKNTPREADILETANGNRTVDYQKLISFEVRR